MTQTRRIGLGCMRLSTERGIAEDRAVGVLHAALDAGIRFLDTADVYAPDAASIGHNERLIRTALTRWRRKSREETAGVSIATKGGLTRPKPNGRWIPDGRAKHLEAACHRSREALEQEALDLYLLHTPDPKTPLGTSLRALAKLRDRGYVKRIGVCNITYTQALEALAVTSIDAIQVAMNPLDDTNFRNGVAELCAERNIELIAHSPYGGRRAAALRKMAGLRTLADRLGVNVYALALAWLNDLSPALRPIPGTTDVDHIAAMVEAFDLKLEATARQELDHLFMHGRLLRAPRSTRKPRADAAGDVCLIIGRPGAGKSTLAGPLVDQGYVRLNRDTRGGRLKDLIAPLDALLTRGHRKIVLDNTYGLRSTRNEVIECAWRHGVPARCIYIETPLEQAQVHVITRMLNAYGRLLDPDELTTLARSHPDVLSPSALFRFERTFEPPDESEGFSVIDRVRLPPRTMATSLRPGVLFDLGSTSLGELARIQALRDDGHAVAAFAWEPGETDDATPWFNALGSGFEVFRCRHPAGPPVCWCRPPLPGLPLLFSSTKKVNLQASILIGSASAHRTMAERVGMRHLKPRE